MRRFAVLLILMSGIVPAWAQHDWIPSKEDIDTFETKIHLPDWGRSTQYPNGHLPTPSEFSRYYTGTISNGHRILLGELHDAHGADNSIHIVATTRAFPLIADGGCHVVHVRYDLDSQQAYLLNVMAWPEFS